MDSYSSGSDSSGLEGSGYYNDEQRAAINRVNQLVRRNEERGWRRHFIENPMSDEMEVAKENAAAAAQNFLDAGREVQRTWAAYERRPESESRIEAYENALEAHGQAIEQYVRYFGGFHEEVNAALNYEDSIDMLAQDATQQPAAEQAGQGPQMYEYQNILMQMSNRVQLERQLAAQGNVARTLAGQNANVQGAGNRLPQENNRNNNSHNNGHHRNGPTQNGAHRRRSGSR
ncbi:hypothetical protein ACJ6WF_15175 [Streptomyces sp. MMS24-I2-30]|uniref:hypothetical protein n=1 Tax=Streptomyces sp. MMS24-I2-30 TaxID=3351564 RepID=UPI003896C403